ncbi:hypothetical protein [Sediminispirochaeta bajacaliforniensis]|uniref:hypothetical protein n=1 Tax=Sediminispirochaeta bajacaliforniensis TaxID=148 RepID=UPI00037BB69F|nr:hypothetical protein [Sediminispirochaeta bajacaliforniensis]
MKKTKHDYMKELRSPAPLANIDDLDKEIESRPNYVGPGAWIAVAKERMKESIKEICTNDKRPT